MIDIIGSVILVTKPSLNAIDFDRWFSEARNDLFSGKLLYLFRRYNNAVFYFVQAAGKALKALLFYHNVKSWGHSLSDLLDLLEQCGIKINTELRQSAREVERHYMSSRYPDITPHYSPKKAYDRKLAKEIRTHVKGLFMFVEKERG